MSLTVRLDQAIETELDRYCATQDISKSSVVHQALKSWLEQQASSGHALLGFVTSSKRAAKDAQPYTPYSKQALRAKLQAKAAKS